MIVTVAPTLGAAGSKDIASSPWQIGVLVGVGVRVAVGVGVVVAVGVGV